LCHIHEIIAKTNIKKITPFSSRIVTVLELTCKSLIHFEVI
jgi:hypothetical protein